MASDAGVEDGLLVLHQQVLVAIFVCLDQATYGSDRGKWHLECGFGRCSARQMTFPKLEAALCWMADRLGIDQGEATVCAHRHLYAADGHANR